MNRISRRSFGVTGAAGAVVGLMGKVPEARAATPSGPAAPASAPMPAWLIAPLKRGSDLGSGWSLANVAGVVQGAFVLELVNLSGRHVELHLSRLAGAARGIASSKHLDFLLMNGGDGGVPSDEELGLVVLSLARRITENEERRGASARLPASVISHDARLAQYKCL